MDRRRFKKFRLMLFILACMFIRCNRDTELVIPVPQYEPPQDLRKIIPLKIGNRWEYTRNGCAEANCETSMVSTEIIDTVSIDSVSHFLYQPTGTVPGPYYLSAYTERVDSNQYTRYLCGCGKSKPQNALSTTNVWSPSVLLKLPIKVGQKWQVPGLPLHVDTVTIGNVDTTIVTDAGKFEHAIWVHSINSIYDNLYYEYFIVPGVGIVYSIDDGFFTYYVTYLTKKNF